MTLVTTSEAAEAVGVHLVTLQRWVKQGLVTPTERTAGGHFRWDVDDLRRQLQAHKERPAGTGEPPHDHS